MDVAVGRCVVKLVGGEREEDHHLNGGGGGNIRAINVNEEGRMVELRTQNLVEILIMND